VSALNKTVNPADIHQLAAVRRNSLKFHANFSWHETSEISVGNAI